MILWIGTWVGPAELYGNHIDLLELPFKRHWLNVFENLATFSQMTATFVRIIGTDSLTAVAFVRNQFWAHSVLTLQVYNFFDFL